MGLAVGQRGSAIIFTALPVMTFREGLMCLVGHSIQVEFEGKALFESIRTVHIDRIDPIEALFGGSNDLGAFLGNFSYLLPGSAHQLIFRHHLIDRAVVLQFLG